MEFISSIFFLGNFFEGIGFPERGVLEVLEHDLVFVVQIFERVVHFSFFHNISDVSVFKEPNHELFESIFNLGIEFRILFIGRNFFFQFLESSNLLFNGSKVIDGFISNFFIVLGEFQNVFIKVSLFQGTNNDKSNILALIFQLFLIYYFLFSVFYNQKRSFLIIREISKRSTQSFKCFHLLRINLLDFIFLFINVLFCDFNLERFLLEFIIIVKDVLIKTVLVQILFAILIEIKIEIQIFKLRAVLE